MRIPYSSLNGFKAKAKHLQALLGIGQVATGLEVLAQLSGYQNYHEVRNTENLEQGAAQAPEDVLAHLLTLRPELSHNAALGLLTKMALFPAPKALAPAPLQPETPPGATVSLPPSAIAHFLARQYGVETCFTTPQFAGYFVRTVLESQAILNEYSDKGFLTHTGLHDGIESWTVSRDGMRAFGVGRPAKKLSKKELQSIELALWSSAKFLSSYGVQELSIGGRPAFGRPSGTLAVGALLTHEPFAHENDVQILRHLYHALKSAVPGDYFSVFLFEACDIPERLRERRVLTGENIGEIVVAVPNELDVDEARHWRRYNRIAGSEFSRMTGGDFDDLMFRHVVERERYLSEIPLRCIRSDFKYPTNTGQYLKQLEGLTESELNREREDYNSRFRGYPDTLLAEVDYAISTDSLLTFVRELQQRDYSYRFGVFAVTPEEFARRLSIALLVQREQQEKKRDSKANREKLSGSSEAAYFAVFDCLNYPKPKLVGFVRQPPGGSNSFAYLERGYDRLLSQAVGTEGYSLHKNGYSAAYLSLIERTATAEEVSAYKTICKRFDTSFKAILLAGKEPIGYRAQYARREQTIGPVASQLYSAEMTLPIVPKLLRGFTRDAREENLFTFVQGWAPDAQWRAKRCFVDLDTLDMLDFVRRAVTSPTQDPIVLSASILDTWCFTQKAHGWQAALQDGQWAVTLCSKGTVLDISLSWGEAVHTQRLSPVKIPYGHTFKGNFGALLPFFGAMRNARSKGLEACWASDFERREFPDTPAARVAWLSELADAAFHGDWRDFEYGDGTAWPYMGISSEEGPPPV